MTGLRVRRVEKDRFERFRAIVGFDGRSPPHWEVFRVVLRLAETSLPPDLRDLVRD